MQLPKFLFIQVYLVSTHLTEDMIAFQSFKRAMSQVNYAAPKYNLYGVLSRVTLT